MSTAHKSLPVTSGLTLKSPSRARHHTPATVSVILPCFNAGEFIEECVESVVAQDVPDRELIVVDDGSTDRTTVEVLSRLERKFDVLLIRTENRGISEARNTGFSHSSGRFILFLDSDDRIGENFLRATLHALMERSDCGVAFTDIERFGLENGTWRTGPVLFQAEILLDNYLQPYSLVRREVVETVGGFSPDLTPYEDWDFWIKLHTAGVRFVKVRHVRAFYRKIANGMLATHHWRRPYVINRLILNHKATYERLFTNRIGDREERWVLDLLRDAVDRPQDPEVTRLLRRTRLYRQFICYSAIYRACRKLLGPVIRGRR